MNHIYRIVRNRSTGMLQAVCETATAQGKSSAGAHGTGICATTHRQPTPSAVSAAIAALFGAVFALCMATPVHAAPTGGQITAGQGSISQTSTASGSGINTTINQTTPKLAINWQQFGSAAGEHIQFNQPGASAIALNRVVGNEQSQLMGSLSANGQVFILNPNGILFGKGAQVNVGGLVASTLNMSDADFMAGNYRFAGSNSSGKIENHGNLSTNGGIIALIAPAVENQGNITAHGGQVALTAGSQVTLTPQGQLYGITVDAGAVQAQITNGGIIAAEGGKIHLTAKAWDALSSALIKHSGQIEATTSALNEKGEVILLADMQHGTTEVSGSIRAKGTHAGTDGGFIETSGAQVNVADSARISTQANGGKTGIWLIDPTDYTIAATGGNMTGAALYTNLGNTDVTIQTQAEGSGNGDIFVNDAVSWNANTTLTLNAYRNININRQMDGGSAGKLALEYGQGAVADGNTATYNVNAPVNLAAGDNFSTKLGSNGMPITYTVITSVGEASHATASGNNTLQGMAHADNLAKSYALGADIDANSTSGWEGGKGFAPIGANANSFSGNFDGLGHKITNLTINRTDENHVGLFGMADEYGAISNIGLVGASVTGSQELVGGSSVGGLVGSNSATISNSYVTGTVTGLDAGGLVGFNSGAISNSYATANITGARYVGGLVGGQESGQIIDSFAKGDVAGRDNSSVGGLLGFQYGSNVLRSYATGAVTGGKSSAVGGLVGQNSGSIWQSYATGAVSGNQNANVGGLVGQGRGPIWQSYATGAVSGDQNANVGGLVGYVQNGEISQSYATGEVHGNNAASAGGLVGYVEDSSITNSYWDKETTKQSNACGAGTCSDANAQGLSTVEAFKQANYTIDENNQFNFTTDWYMVEDQTRPLLRAFNAQVAGTENGKNIYYISNLMQLQGMAADLGGVYYLTKDIDASPTATSVAAGSNAPSNQSDVWGGKGFAPIGKYTWNNPATSFTGKFDGLGHSISGLAINRTSQNHVGLFGATDKALIQNVGLVGGSVKGGTYDVGGLVGYQSGGTVSNSFTTGSVIGTYDVGGLVGQLIGIGAITNSYATGSVRGTSNIGGLVGLNQNGSISYSYATGGVSGSSSLGGLVGSQRDTATISNSYWNKDTTGQQLSAGTLTATYAGKTSFEMKQAGTFTGWSIDSAGGDGGKIWRIYEGYTSPLLKVFLKPLTVTATVSDNNKTYNGTNQNATVNNYSYSTPDGTVDGAKILGTTTTSNNSQRNAGSYVLAYGGGLYSIQSGYDILPNANLGTLIINKANLTLNAVTDTKTYDGNTSSSQAVTQTGLQAGDNFTATQSFDSKDVATATTLNINSGYSINDGNNGGNYNVSTNSASGTISAKTVTVGSGITAVNKTYDGSTSAPLNTGGAVFTGVITGESLTVTATGTFDNKNAADGKTVTLSNLALGNGAGGLASNYQLANNGNQSETTASIIAKALTITANDHSITYGDAAANNGVSYNGFIAGESQSNLSGTLGYSYGYSQYGNVGSYTITPGGLSSSNYAITFANGTLSVGQKEVGLNWGNHSNLTYNGQLQSVTATANGLVNSDAVTVTLTGHQQTNAGNNYTATATGLGGSTAGNYKLLGATTQNWAIAKANLTAIAASRTYDGTTKLSGSDFSEIKGVGSETLTLTGTGDNSNLASKNATNGTAVQLASVAGLTLGNGSNGGWASNYNWDASGLAAIGTNQVTINKANISAVTGITAGDKVYDGNTSATLTTSGAGIGFTGKFDNDELTVANATGVFADKNVGTSKTVNITGITLGGNDAGNYNLTNTTGSTTASTINKANLTVRANDQTHFQGQAFVFNGTEFTATGLVANESIARAELSSTGAAASVLPVNMTFS